MEASYQTDRWSLTPEDVLKCNPTLCAVDVDFYGIVGSTYNFWDFRKYISRELIMPSDHNKPMGIWFEGKQIMLWKYPDLLLKNCRDKFITDVNVDGGMIEFVLVNDKWTLNGFDGDKTVEYYSNLYLNHEWTFFAHQYAELICDKDKLLAYIEIPPKSA